MLAQWNSALRTSFGGFHRAGLFKRGLCLPSGISLCDPLQGFHRVNLRASACSAYPIKYPMTTALTSDPGKAVLQNSAVQIAVNDLFDVGSKEPVLPSEPVIIDHFEGFKMIFHALVIWRVLGIAPPVNRCLHEYRRLSVW